VRTVIWSFLSACTTQKYCKWTFPWSKSNYNFFNILILLVPEGVTKHWRLHENLLSQSAPPKFIRHACPKCILLHLIITFNKIKGFKTYLMMVNTVWTIVRIKRVAAAKIETIAHGVPRYLLINRAPHPGHLRWQYLFISWHSFR